MSRFDLRAMRYRHTYWPKHARQRHWEGSNQARAYFGIISSFRLGVYEAFSARGGEVVIGASDYSGQFVYGTVKLLEQEQAQAELTYAIANEQAPRRIFVKANLKLYTNSPPKRKRSVTRRHARNNLCTMNSESDVEMEQGFTNKGKGKAQEQNHLPVENLPWVEKYRPVSLDEVVSHQQITSTIEKFIEKNRLPHLLFYGPPGTGKTSTILAVARKIYDKDYKRQTLELNASDDRGIDVVREQIKQFAETRTLFNKGFKLIVLDEADMMTSAAQSALRRVVEQYTKNVRFCIICNYVNKIIPAIQSRCTRFRFSPLKSEEVERRIQDVIQAENVKITPEGTQALLKLSKGDMRRALNVLQACHAAYDLIAEDEIYACTGNPHPSDIEAIVNTMMTAEFTTAYQTVIRLKTERGLALQDLIIGAYEYLENLELPPQSRVYLLDFIATTEHRLSTGGNERIQLTALLAAFKTAVQLASSK